MYLGHSWLYLLFAGHLLDLQLDVVVGGGQLGLQVLHPLHRPRPHSLPVNLAAKHKG